MDVFTQYIGQVFDQRYRIEKIIGVGGMAVVFEATDLVQKRTVAVKMLRDEMANDEPSVKRFINESKAVATCSHPNIVKIYSVSVKENLKYIVMERINGITLKSYMDQKGALQTKDAILFTEQILRALEHAHSKGIIHRDIKPQNIMLLKNGLIKVTDFGIAKMPNAETVTMTDKAIGTVFYISPEQAGGKTIDQRSDLYSLGVMMYEMLTGKLPFTADSPVTVALKQINDDAEPLRNLNASVPKSLEQFVEIAMAKDPDCRFQNATQMLKQLERIKANPNVTVKSNAPKSMQSGGARRSNPMLPVIVGVVAAALIVFGVTAAILLSRYFSEAEQTQAASEIEVVSVLGKLYTDDLKKELEEEHYTILEKYVNSEDFPENQIIGQNPAPGEKRKLSDSNPTCDLTLTISNGVKTFELEDYTTQDYREVQNRLKNLGVATTVEKEYHDSILVDYVISTDPPAGTVLKSTSETVVTLHVSMGQEVQFTLVPNFVGLTEGEANSALREAELSLGTVTYRQSMKDKGTILEQSVTATSSVLKNQVIDFIVSGGPDYVPPVIETEPPEGFDTEEPAGT